jgi:hypothetical protein
VELPPDAGKTGMNHNLLSPLKRQGLGTKPQTHLLQKYSKSTQYGTSIKIDTESRGIEWRAEK